MTRDEASWWTLPIPRDGWKHVLSVEQPIMERSPEGRKAKLLQFIEGDGGRRFKTAVQLAAES